MIRILLVAIVVLCVGVAAWAEPVPEREHLQTVIRACTAESQLLQRRFQDVQRELQEAQQRLQELQKDDLQGPAVEGE